MFQKFYRNHSSTASIVLIQQYSKTDITLSTWTPAIWIYLFFQCKWQHCTRMLVDVHINMIICIRGECSHSRHSCMAGFIRLKNGSQTAEIGLSTGLAWLLYSKPSGLFHGKVDRVGGAERNTYLIWWLHACRWPHDRFHVLFNNSEFLRNFRFLWNFNCFHAQSIFDVIYKHRPFPSVVNKVIKFHILPNYNLLNYGRMRKEASELAVM